MHLKASSPTATDALADYLSKNNRVCVLEQCHTRQSLSARIANSIECVNLHEKDIFSIG